MNLFALNILYRKIACVQSRTLSRIIFQIEWQKKITYVTAIQE